MHATLDIGNYCSCSRYEKRAGYLYCCALCLTAVCLLMMSTKT